MSTSTLNIKPLSVASHNVRPQSFNTTNYAAYVNSSTATKYKFFKYGARKYGTSLEYSAGQIMPNISTISK